MLDTHPNLFGLLDLAIGRSPRSTVRHVERCEPCATRAQGVNALVRHGRAYCAAPRLERRHVRTAMRVFRSTRPSWMETTLQLVTDCLLGAPVAVPALRHAGPQDGVRFVRYEGARTVELQISVDAARVTLHGCVLPPEKTVRVQLLSSGREYATLVDESGGFVFRDLPTGKCDLVFGQVRIESLTL